MPASGEDVRPSLITPERTGEAEPGFRVVIAYNNLAAGMQAMRGYQVLGANFRQELEFGVSLWKFGILHQPGLLQAAVADALKAPVVIVSIQGESDLSAPAKRWLELWTRDRERHGMLLALLDAGSFAEASSTEVYLGNLAVTANMDFLLHRFQPVPAVERNGLNHSAVAREDCHKELI